jgi:flagellar biosynthesis anti-sigma factor FlgM
MSMEIPDKLPRIHPAPKIHTDLAGCAALDKSARSVACDRVLLSEQARLLQAAREAVKQMPQVDLEKVTRIQAQLAQGRYRIDPDKIASKILQDALLHDLE